MHPIDEPPHRPRSGPRIVAVLALLAAVIATVTSSVPPAAAQAKLVNALVHTVPSRPDPGDDVTVLVSVTGCPRGPVTAEVYLTTSDGATQSATLMTRAAATTNLLFRTRAVLSLPHALEGWYGVRVLCGTFRPPKEAMTNTLFAVGSKPTRESRLGGDTVKAGASLPFSGNGCPGTTVEYQISAGSRWAGPFVADGTIPVGPDGSWSTDLVFPPESSPGPASVRARCVLSSPYQEALYVYYGGLTQVTIER